MSATSAGHSQDSFRDPAGFIFKHNDQIYRQINQDGQADYDFFMSSGLYDELIKQELIVSHEEINSTKAFGADSRRYKIIKPKLIPFISYPYEWSFDQLKSAGLLTLKIQKIALDHGMILKDASAYNVQFLGNQPVFIDSLSFRVYEPGVAWDGYKQFCEHFIAPLAIASYNSPETLTMLKSFLDGVPLGIATTMLPKRAKLNTSLLAHVYVHAASQKRYNSRGGVAKQRKLSVTAMNGLMESLKKAVSRLNIDKKQSEWSHYYENTNYSDSAFNAKKKLVDSLLKQVTPKPVIVWDMGANDGTFSELGAARGAYTVAFDVDVRAVNKNYRQDRGKNLNKNILPLVQDLTNPSPSLGWAHKERASLEERGPADVVLALALIHHLAIGNNTPLSAVASYFAQISRYLIIEFVPKGDSKVDKMLSSRANGFDGYTQECFEEAFGEWFKLVDKKAVKGSERIIYLYKH